MRYLFLLLLFLGSSCIAEVVTIDKRENFFLTSTDLKIHSKANPVTGEYSEEEIDLIVAGCEPLSVRRFYNHFAPYDNGRYGNWRYNPETELVANFEWDRQECFASIGDKNGSVCSFQKSSSSPSVFRFSVPKGFASASEGQSHPLNTKIRYRKNTQEKNFSYLVEAKDGSGRKRFFCAPNHKWLHLVKYVEKKSGFMWGSETEFAITPNAWTPYQIPLQEERLPNGNLLCYTYETWHKEKYPLPGLLKTITAYNADKSKILGYIKFQYHRDKHNTVIGIEIEGSDGRKTFIDQKGDPLLLVSSKGNEHVPIQYRYQGRKLCSIEKPNGRVFNTEYDKNDKVKAQYAPVGARGELCTVGKYDYYSGHTDVFDAEGYKTIYSFDENKKLTQITRCSKTSYLSIQKMQWDPKTGNLLKKVLADPQGKVFQFMEYAYDENQNPIKETIGDTSSSYTTYRTFSKDGFNLKTAEWDDFGKKILYSYLSNTNLLTSEFVYENNHLRKRTFHVYDNAAVCIKTVTDDGSGASSDDLTNVTYRHITLIKPKETLPCYGLPEVQEKRTIDKNGREILLSKVVYTYTAFGKILREDHFDAENAYHFSLHNEYDSQERLIAKVDALGHRMTFVYDENSNLVSSSGPRPDQHKIWVYDKANRPIEMIETQTDGAALLTKKRYDKLGQVISETDLCGLETRYEYDAFGHIVSITYPDGAIERKEYDILGNVIKEIDPKGYLTQKTFNYRGQPLSIFYPDGSKESFVYNNNGTLALHIDKNGAKHSYTCDVFGHIIKTETRDEKGNLLKTTSATYSPFALLSEKDGEGNTTCYSYDFSGRKISETIGARTTRFTYDSFGRLEKTDHEYFQQIENHDKAGHLTSKSLLSDTIQFQETYAYDQASNLTHRITSHGTFRTQYNTLGKPLLETNPAGYQTTYTYHFNDHYRETITDANHLQTTHVHDSRGREIASIKTNSKGETLSKSKSDYDKNGNLTSQTYYVFNGPNLISTITHRWEYGPMGRLERFVEAGEKQTQYVYDEKGRLKTTIKPSDIQFHHEYDPLGRLSRYFSRDFDYHYTYDRNDRLLSVHDSVTKTTTTKAYNALGDITQETLGTGLTLHNTYDSQGRRIQLILPDNSEIHYAYRGAFLYNTTRNGHTFTYRTRDLEGHPLRLELPAQLGTITITRDLLSRIASFTSSVYASRFSQDAYDPIGNLLQYHYEDPLGAVKCTYAYDQLNQLIAEDEHTYLFDSLNNRLEKDHAPHIINALCQILHDGNTSYEYDLDGNLIFDGTWRYVYDTQDRLIALEKGTQRIQYTYDPFHRRLSKALFTNGSCIHYERYLWDGDNEIGAVNDKGVITQLRILGEGLGAEIGAAVLHELNGKTYVPIHDHNGNLAVLIDIKTQKPVETYRYTAFGEELTSTQLSPWRFSSKRIDEERGLIFFGRRYYLPELGRWMTQDPQGFEDGPNLYAYLSNCPPIRIDPYGLTGNDSWSLQNVLGPCCGLVGGFFGIGLPKDYQSFENLFNNKSRTFSLNHDFEFDFPEPSIGSILFVNGVGNAFSDLKEKARVISTHSGYNTRGVYNATHSVPVDAHEAIINMVSHIRTPPVYNCQQACNNYFDNDTTGAPLLLLCHSQGAPIVRNMLEIYPKERRDRIIVAAIAPFAYISPKQCMQVRHYVCPSDPLPYGDFKNRWACKDTITYVRKMPNCKQSCHEFLNPIYSPYIEKEIKDYQEKLQKYVR